MDNHSELLRARAFWFVYQLGEPGCEDQVDEEPVLLRLIDVPTYALELSVTLSLHVASLLLLNLKTGERQELGWWDDGRWHPFALRWAELQQILHHGKASPDSVSLGEEAIILLLGRFVGNGADETEAFPVRRERVADAYRHLNLFSAEEVERLTAGTLFEAPERDYRWTEDPSLGWCFSGSYPCYSIRNPQHASGEEGYFPFEGFGRFIQECGE